MILYAGGARCDYFPLKRTLVILHPLSTPRVVLIGPRYWRFCRDSQPNPDCWAANRYDFTDDVRELVCDPIRPDVYAMWADPRERWT
jgi:hypothetical protein